MNRIKFTEDWDKLREPRFTTIRSYNPGKEEYYRAHIGEAFSILRIRTYRSHPFIGRKIGSATLTDVRVVVPGGIPAAVLHRDVLRGGKPDTEWMERLLAMDRALLLEFENHTGILAEAPP